MNDNLLDIETVGECNSGRTGDAVRHSMAGITGLDSLHLSEGGVRLGSYAVIMLDDFPDSCFGRMYCDFSDATMIFLKPGTVFRAGTSGIFRKHGKLLVFQPDMLAGGGHVPGIDGYGFFSYRAEEALHISRREKAVALQYMRCMEDELCAGGDIYSDTIVSHIIGLLLDYCCRFYERQFTTREILNKETVARLDILLSSYISSGSLREYGRFRSLSDYAAAFGLSDAYFRDLLRFETGKTFSEYCSLKQVESAVRMLSGTDDPVCEIASLSGFRDVESFSLFFRKLTGKLPDEYRHSCC